jgi:hypothetical protein
MKHLRTRASSKPNSLNAGSKLIFRHCAKRLQVALEVFDRRGDPLVGSKLCYGWGKQRYAGQLSELR